MIHRDQKKKFSHHHKGKISTAQTSNTYAINPSISSGLKQQSLCLYGRGNIDLVSLSSPFSEACLFSVNLMIV